MMEFSTKNLRFLAHMGSRGAFGQAVFDMAEKGDDFYALSADLGHASGFDRLIENYPEKYVNVGIAEQDLVGVASGLSAGGRNVIATTYAPFASLRCADQLKNYMGYMKYNINVVGMDSGMIQSHFGASHFGMEDIAILRAIPDVVILCPCDAREIYEATVAMMQCDKPVYLRLTGGQTLPMIHKTEDYHFTIGKAVTVQEGNKVAVIGTGSVLKNAWDAAKLVEKETGITPTVIDMHTIKPLDKEMLDSLMDYDLVVTVEEHSVCGGLGSAVAEHYALKKNSPAHLILGIDDFYPHPGDYKYVLECCKLDKNGIAESILQTMKELG